MLELILILSALIISGIVLISPKVSGSQTWRATVTPLASIIGSGFLVLGPILLDSYGWIAPIVMAALCGLAFSFGSAIRFNISALDSSQPIRGKTETMLENAASVSLGFAYIISVAYYLNLFGAFAVSLTPYDTALAGKIATSLVFAFILFLGWFRGFSALENTEKYAVSLKLAIIAGMLAGLVVFFADHWKADELLIQPVSITGWAAISLGFGLLITVQGFETSRYLGEEYDAGTRIRTMRLAQYLSTIIYVVYICLIAYVFTPSEVPETETGIINMMVLVSPILPVLLVVAALSAQFSAATADTIGAGGLFSRFLGFNPKPRYIYAFLVGIGLLLTWYFSIFQIIAYASRAFAFYYGIQAAIAARTSFRTSNHLVRTLFFASLAVLGMLITAFGAPVE